VLAVELEGASFRHPVIVIFRSALEVLLCGGEAVCATIAAVAKPTMAVNAPVQILLLMLPPECVPPATLRPETCQVDVNPGRRFDGAAPLNVVQGFRLR
jgi:hypothetical protein